MVIGVDELQKRGVRWTGPRLIVTRASKPVLDLFEEASVVSDRGIKSP
jgi:hypothetical protein